MTTNNKLKAFRESKNMTQIELAKELGVTNDYISIIERGVQNPGFVLANKIAKYFDTTIDEIFFAD